MRSNRQIYQCADTALLRTSTLGYLALPEWPDVPIESSVGTTAWVPWLRAVWERNAVAGAIEHASPVLARQVEAVLVDQEPDVRQVRRTLLSVVRYVLRMNGRSTPVGLFAGISSVSFGTEATVAFGARHRAVARADAVWLVGVIASLESCRELLGRLPVMANSATFIRDDRLVVPYPPRSFVDDGSASAEVSVRRTEAVRLAVVAAQAPIRFDALADKLAADFPATPARTIEAMLVSLVTQHVLITSLRAPSRVTDAFRHLMEQLKDARADDIAEVAQLVSDLSEIRIALDLHNETDTVSVSRRIRSTLTERMSALVPVARRPLAVDLRIDCSLLLPRRVAVEAQAAASVLTRLSAYPFGTRAWADFLTRFFERYGVDSPVPLLDVVDPDIGLGFPAGYLGSGPEPHDPLTARHRRLLALAQAAALDGRLEVVLDEQLVGELAPADQEAVRVPRHVELCFHLQSPTLAALRRGDFELVVTSASRAAGTMTGRFLDLLEPPERERATAVFDQLAADPDDLAVQVCFQPLDPRNAHVTRAPEVLPAVISVAEHRPPDGRTIPLDDIAVMCDKHQLHLVSLSRGRRLSPTMLNALDLRAHTPPLVRFLVEVAKAQHAVFTGFDWGPAVHLPYLPRLRYGCTVLSPARWRLESAELPGPAAPWPTWSEAAAGWRERRRLPSTVFLVEGDHRLKLDLGMPAHLSILRAHLDRSRTVVLTEASTAPEHGWFGGRSHEIVTTLTAIQPSISPIIPLRTTVTRGHGHLPGAPPWLHVKLYGHPERVAHLLGRHLPVLLGAWESPPRWWYTRFRDPDWHLRLRIAVAGPAEFAVAAQRVARWADGLRLQGLVRDMQFASTYPETGRWGEGPSLEAAEEVFAADSAALLGQFAVSGRQHPHVLAAAHFVSIACDFTGSTEAGMTRLLKQTDAAPPVERALLKDAVRLADPADGWNTLKAEHRGQAITASWAARSRALAAYRHALIRAGDADLDKVLDSLLHAHHLRAFGIAPDSERVCRRLARAAALAWQARRTGDRK